MRVIQQRRRTGKTTQVVKEVIKTNGILLVPDVEQKRMLIDTWQELNMHNVYTWEEYNHVSKQGASLEDRHLYVDNIDSIVENILNHSVTCATVSY